MAITEDSATLSFDLVPESQVEAAIDNEYDRIKWPNRTASQIDQATWQIRGSIVQGINQGEDYTQMAKNVSDRMGKTAAEMQRIARTEGHRARSAGQLDCLNSAYEKGLNIEKEWVSALDDRTRDSHALLDGQTVKMTDQFTSPITGAKAQAPGMFGVASEDINCRCSMVGITPGERFEYRGYKYDDIPGSYIGKYANYMDWAQKKGIKPHLFDGKVNKIIQSLSPKQLAWIKESQSPNNLLTGQDREKYFINLGYTAKEYEQMQALLNQYGLGGKMQQEAVVKIFKELSQTTRLGSILREQIKLEEALNRYWLNNSPLPFYKKVVYRKGELGKTIESWTSNPEGAWMGRHIGVEHQASFEEIRKRGYSILGGGSKMMGAPGEGEITFIKFLF